MNDDRKKPLWPWIVALLIGLPVLYVLSSGPAQRIGLCGVAPLAYSNWSDGIVVLPVELERGEWWYDVYSPLVQASQESWGNPLASYWNLFGPFRDMHLP